MPVIPFIAGGEYAVGNLHTLPSVVGMRLRCEFYRETKHLSPGEKVRIVIVKAEKETLT